LQFARCGDKVFTPSLPTGNALLSALRYYWITARGYRLRPWRSPYLRWRMETFFGPQADPLTASRFLTLMWQERRRMAEFIAWANAVSSRRS
jgi:hypothetical protein